MSLATSTGLESFPVFTSLWGPHRSLFTNSAQIRSVSWTLFSTTVRITFCGGKRTCRDEAMANRSCFIKRGECLTNRNIKDSLPNGFKEVVTMNTAKKAIRVGGKDVFEMNLIYSRVLELQQSRDIDFTDVLRYELAPLPLPTWMFKDTGDMCTAAGKSSLKKKLNVTLPLLHVNDAEVTIIDGCAILWCIHCVHEKTVPLDNVR